MARDLPPWMTPGSMPLEGKPLEHEGTDPESALSFIEQSQSEKGLDRLDLHWQIECQKEGGKAIYVVEIPSGLSPDERIEWLQNWFDDFGDVDWEYVDAYCDDAYFGT